MAIIDTRAIANKALIFGTYKDPLVGPVVTFSREQLIRSLDQAVEEQNEADIRLVEEWLRENRWSYDQSSDHQFSDMIKQLRKAMKGGSV